MNKIPPMTTVQSSTIEAIGYDESAQELHVQFKSGGCYVYLGVPRSVFNALMQADSVGSFLHKKIKNVFKHKKIEKQEDAMRAKPLEADDYGWESFVIWADANGVGINPEDWTPWWECWKSALIFCGNT